MYFPRIFGPGFTDPARSPDPHVVAKRSAVHQGRTRRVPGRSRRRRPRAARSVHFHLLRQVETQVEMQLTKPGTAGGLQQGGRSWRRQAGQRSAGCTIATQADGRCWRACAADDQTLGPDHVHGLRPRSALRCRRRDDLSHLFAPGSAVRSAGKVPLLQPGRTMEQMAEFIKLMDSFKEGIVRCSISRLS